MSHHTITLKGMARISADEKPVSFAKRLASTFSVPSLHVVFFNQAKIARLKAHVVLVFEACNFGLSGR